MSHEMSRLLTMVILSALSVFLVLSAHRHQACCTGLGCQCIAWWRHQMETFSALLSLCAGNSPVTGEFPSQRPVTRSFDVFYLRLNKRLSKHSRRLWFETPLWSLRRHCNRTCDCPRDSKLTPYDLYDMVECVKQVLYVTSTKQDTTQLCAYYKGYTVQNNQRSVHCC